MNLNKLKIFSTLHGLIFDMHVYDFPGKTHLPFRIYSTWYILIFCPVYFFVFLYWRQGMWTGLLGMKMGDDESWQSVGLTD